MDLLLEFGLGKTALNLGPCYPQLIREFIINLSANFDDPTSRELSLYSKTSICDFFSYD